MKTSEAGIAFIKQHEGVRHESYRDSVGVWTVGVGHTGPDVLAGMHITDDDVDRLLRDDVAEAEACVENHCDVALSQNQFDALVSFVFNLGCQAFRNSTLLRLLNQGRYAEAAQQFRRWTHAGEWVSPGLVTRRKDEAEMFLA